MIPHFSLTAKLEEDAITHNEHSASLLKCWKANTRHRCPLPYPTLRDRPPGSVRGGYAAADTEESNLKTLFHNYGKFFTFMLY